MKKIIILAVVLVLILAGCSNKNGKTNLEEESSNSGENNISRISQMPESYQSSLTNRLGAMVRACYENEWTNQLSNGRAIARFDKEMRGLAIELENCKTAGNIIYQAHEVSGGWLNEAKNGEELVSDNSSINAVRIKLSDQYSDTYNVYTKVFQNNKWSEWELNGNTAGDEDGVAITGICVEIREKIEGVPDFYLRDFDTNQNMISLTFDDTPGEKETDILLDILKEYDACATFFVVGQNINDENMDSLKRIIAEGSEIGIHTYGHDNLTEISKEEVISTCCKCSWLIESITNFRPVVMRAPGGNCNEEALNALKTIDLPNVLWSVDSQDWKKKDSEKIAKIILKEVEEGSLILAHDTKEQTIEAMKIVIPELVNRGYKFVTVSELFAYNGGICAGKEYSGIGGEEGQEGEGEGFNDITILDGDAKVDFCGVDFEDTDKEITLNICCDNPNEEARKFEMSDMEVNESTFEIAKFLGALDESSSEVFEFIVSNVPGVDYEEIKTIKFSVKIYDKGGNEIAKTKTVTVNLDTQNETFSATVE